MENDKATLVVRKDPRRPVSFAQVVEKSSFGGLISPDFSGHVLHRSYGTYSLRNPHNRLVFELSLRPDWQGTGASVELAVVNGELGHNCLIQPSSLVVTERSVAFSAHEWNYNGIGIDWEVRGSFEDESGEFRFNSRQYRFTAVATRQPINGTSIRSQSIVFVALCLCFCSNPQLPALRRALLSG